MGTPDPSLDDLPRIYREDLTEAQIARLQAAFTALAERRVATLASLPAGIDPRSLEEIDLEHHMRRLINGFMVSSKLRPGAQADILVVALANTLGSILMTGVRDSADANERMRRIRGRIMLFAEDELGARR